MPAGWRGEPYGAIKPADFPFPCVGAHCAERDQWHDKGTPCRDYRDRDLINKECTRRGK